MYLESSSRIRTRNSERRTSRRVIARKTTAQARATRKRGTMKIPFTGGCVCGAIRYECAAEPIMMLKCHCRDCQQVSGGGFAAAVLVPAESFRLIRGQLRYHFTPSIRRGKHKRGFCPECGSRMTGAEFEGDDSQFVGVLAASLDDPSWFQPQMDIFVSEAQPWDQMDPAIAKFGQYPPSSAKE
jgi:hypothetical protein